MTYERKLRDDEISVHTGSMKGLVNKFRRIADHLEEMRQAGVVVRAVITLADGGGAILATEDERVADKYGFKWREKPFDPDKFCSDLAYMAAVPGEEAESAVTDGESPYTAEEQARMDRLHAEHCQFIDDKFGEDAAVNWGWVTWEGPDGTPSPCSKVCGHAIVSSYIDPETETVQHKIATWEEYLRSHDELKASGFAQPIVACASTAGEPEAA